MLIVDVDAHHYENENYDEFLPFMENDVLRQLTHVQPRQEASARGIDAGARLGYQDMGGRVTRYPMRCTRKNRGRQASATCSSAIAGWTP